MTVRLHVVTPVTGMSLRGAAAAAPGPGITVTHSRIATGPASIECELDEALAVPATLAEVKTAAETGAAAVVINCMGDPALAAAREIVSVPVVGAGQASMHLAAMLGHRFSILTVLDQLVYTDEAKAAGYGLAGRLASVRSVGIPVLDLDGDEAGLARALTGQGVRAVREDGAHVLILGCTGMLGLADQVAAGLAGHGLAGVPVVDPLPAALAVAASLTRLGLTHSRRTYPVPPVKDRPGYEAVFGASTVPVS